MSKTEEKPKPSKRGSIFGKMSAGWGSMKSPSKEKDQKEAELKPETPAKDTTVSDVAPQLPETTTTEPTEAAAVPAVEETKAENEIKPEATKEGAVSPSSEKKTFLSGLPFMNKRNRSVSPSAHMKEAPAKTEAAPAVPPKDDAVEPAKVEEPAVASTSETTPPATTESAEKPIDKVEEPAKTETTATTPNKRQSVLGSLGRRASKAFNRMQTPKKENTAPTTETKAAETTTAAGEDKPVVNGETKEPSQTIGDVGSDGIQPTEHSTPTVTASA
jgi:hypothetical protein